MNIKVGISISLSGNYSVQGIESFEGLKLWVKHINNRRGIFVEDSNKPHLVELMHYDDQSTVELCRANTEKLILKDKVDILLGPYSSSLALAACEVAQEHDMTLWNHGGSTDEIEERNFSCVINAITPASHYSYGIIDCVRKADPQAKRVAIFSASNSGFSSRIANAAKAYSEQKGFDVREFKFISGSAEFKIYLAKLVGYNADLILSVARAEDDIAIAKWLSSNNINTKARAFVAASIKLFKDELGNNAQGALSSSQWERGVQIKPDIGPTPREFYTSFLKEYGKAPDYVAAQGYNIGLVLEKCIECAKTLEDKALRQTAKSLEFDTFYGKFKTDSKGNQIGHKMVVVQWQNSQKVIVHPQAIAQAQIVYPLI
ncbi:MAG: amino acid ABC transporter substrate-binding protein [Thermodesulfobacteriota bacterium]